MQGLMKAVCKVNDALLVVMLSFGNFWMSLPVSYHFAIKTR